MRSIVFVVIVFWGVLWFQACLQPTAVSQPIAVSESSSTPSSTEPEDFAIISLPEPKHNSGVSLEQTLLLRRSVRSYKLEPLSLEETSQLLWAAQGVNDVRGFRTAPSAGALYPLEIYVIAGNVQGLSQGVYHYVPDKHELLKVADGDKRHELAGAALSQRPVSEGAIDLVFSAVYSRTTAKYGERGVRYVHIEVGHAGQNVCLQATALGLGSVTIGAFNDELVTKLLNMTQEEKPLYIISVGRI